MPLSYCFFVFPVINVKVKITRFWNMVKKGQVNNLNYSGLDDVKYINQLFEIIF
jgi:hypothetical protein